jgi:acetylornithine deacetylase
MTLSSADILAKLVAFDTTSRNSNLELIAWVEAFLGDHGVSSERVYDATGTKANLFATIGPAERSGFILSGHTDTVPVDGQDWTSDPFVLTQKGDRLYGRGTADMKGFLACCLAQVPVMVEADLQTPLHLAFSYDEEVGCIGVRGLIAQLQQNAVQPLGCFVGEPTSMGVVLAHKAKRSFRATFTGKPAHSSRAPDGVSAISFATQLVAFVNDLADELEDGARDALFDVPHSTAHVGTFHGGTALNIVPETAVMDFEVRVLPDQDVEELVGRIGSRLDELDRQMRARDPRCGARLELLAAFPGLRTSPDDEIATLTKRLAQQNDHKKVAYGTEAGLFAQAGIASAIVGPGSIAQAHAQDEFITLDQMARCEAMLDRLTAHCRQSHPVTLRKAS